MDLSKFIDQTAEEWKNVYYLSESDAKLKQILPKVQSNTELHKKLEELNKDIEKVLANPNPNTVNSVAKELGVGTFANAPGFHLNDYLNNLQKKIDSKPAQEVQNIISGLEK